MQKIVTDPLYIRCKKVFESCKTNEQINTAINYYKLAYRKTSPDFLGDIGLSGYLTHASFWDKLLSEVKWK